MLFLQVTLSSQPSKPLGSRRPSQALLEVTCHLPSPPGSSLRVLTPPHSGCFFHLLVSASVLCSCSGRPSFHLTLPSLLSILANFSLQGRDPLPARTALQVPLKPDQPGRAFSIEYLGEVESNTGLCVPFTNIHSSQFFYLGNV